MDGRPVEKRNDTVRNAASNKKKLAVEKRIECADVISSRE